jgi:plasmid stability protein
MERVMPAVTIQNLSENTHKALRLRAAQNGRSTEAEIRSILDAAVDAPKSVPLGSALFKLGRDAELEDGDVDALEQKSKTAAEPISLR